MEKELVKQLGEKIGYGNMMYLASELWEKSMTEKGFPTSGVFVPALKSDVRDKKFDQLPSIRDMFDEGTGKYGDDESPKGQRTAFIEGAKWMRNHIKGLEQVKNIAHEPVLAAGYSYKTTEFQLIPDEETNELKIIATNSKKRLYIKPNSDNSCTLSACR